MMLTDLRGRRKGIHQRSGQGHSGNDTGAEFHDDNRIVE